jgi:hypothetical protein
MSLAEIRRTVEDLRAKKAKRSEILLELRKRNPANSDEELRRFYEWVPTGKAKKAARPAQLALLGLLALLIALRVFEGLSLVTSGEPQGWLYGIGVAYLAWLLWLVHHHRLDALFGTVLLVIWQLQATTRSAMLDEAPSFVGLVIALVLFAATSYWRSKLFPNLDWRGRPKPKPDAE